mmetsp:Transcript_5047/g.14511  ORF Transcript_5047/g.14511 Transcript_5047/m.14511 type:complete len:886 (-) Transcript_5047:647-3304(-)|eukprot:CAMPEP_0206136770 /NCGR_PEP_ID=MMETSP1473-20131121/1989_1 /ASSEMBLY_ACC=CAM_ASM_001109 /TAXON_ID=1461547 /ORGANISM="Stichococcus sp, Strain RCC1054" /LENGTH=885 /DNA_ID=CAMNT_0053529517 /DNA_START=134 /DNA_END=2791 /DNA_ORIENTATION=+
MSIRLRDLIRAVRQCKTAAEERTVISKESAALRNAFKNQDTSYRHRNVAKLMFIHMLGYPTHFGQMETLKLIAATGFPEKRIGYLGLMILLDERQEVLMLVTNSLKQDLESRNQHICGLALTALGNICSTEMARDLSPEVERLLGNGSNAYVRKKAALCATRIMRKVPDTIEAYEPLAAALLSDRHHGVLLSGVCLMLEVCEVHPPAVETYRKQVPQLCKILRSLLMSGSTLSGEHDVGGVTDPFLQAKVLRLLKVLGAGNSEASDQMSDILAQVATSTEGNRNAGNAILYEAVQTIMGVEAIGGLRVLAINILGRFLANKDNNIRYVALNTLARVVGVDTQAVQRHRATVVACVKDADVSIRRRALELVYALVNQSNIQALITELLDYLKVCDAEFKPDLTDKICQLVQRFAPEKRWHIDSLLQVMTQPGAVVKEEVVRALIVLISNAPDLHGYSARAFYSALKARPDAEFALVMASTWIIGEYGELLLPGAPGYILAGEASVSASPEQVVDLLKGVAARKDLPGAAREYALTALMKLSARLPGTVASVQELVGSYVASPALEVQTRACEYSASFQHDTIRPHLFEHMPALDEATYSGNLADSNVADAAATTAQDALANGHGAPVAQNDAISALLEMDLVGTGGGGDLMGGAGGGAQSAAAADALSDLLGGDLLGGGGDGASLPAAQPLVPSGGLDLADLLGGGGGDAAPTPERVASASTPADADLFGGIGGDAPAPSHSQKPSAASTELDDLFGPPAPAPAPEPAVPSITAWEKDGLQVAFDFSKPAGSPGVTDIDATYTNSGTETVSDFALQAAVPKFMSLRLAPASGAELAPGSQITQRISVTNNMHGQKALIMRLRIAYATPSAGPTVQQAEVKNFPTGL